MKVSTHLAGGFGFPVLLLIICILTALKALSFSEKQFDHIGNILMAKYKNIFVMTDSLREMGMIASGLIIFEDSYDVNHETKKYIIQKNKFTKASEEINKLMRLDSTADGRQLFSHIENLENKLLMAFDDVIKLGGEGKKKEAMMNLKDSVIPLQEQMVKFLNEMAKLQMQYSENAVNETRSSAYNASTTLLMLTFISISASVLSGFIIITLLIKKLGGEPEIAQQLAASIASGNLITMVPLRRNDKTSLLASLTEMQMQLRNLVKSIQLSSESLANSASDIYLGNNELSHRTEQQATAIQETAASMEKISATVQYNTLNAQQTTASAREVTDLALAGEKKMSEMTLSMNDIYLSAEKIRNITGVIEGIAFQTNIIALNASVEAARAGEDGRGFSVVAREVRGLAQRCALAAKEIKQQIKQSVTLIESGVIVADNTGKNIIQIANMVSELEHRISGISAASQEQLQGISKVNIAIHDIEDVTHSNALMVEKSFTASQVLSEQANTLRNMVGKFII